MACSRRLFLARKQGILHEIREHDGEVAAERELFWQVDGSCHWNGELLGPREVDRQGRIDQSVLAVLWQLRAAELRAECLDTGQRSLTVPLAHECEQMVNMVPPLLVD